MTETTYIKSSNDSRSSLFSYLLIASVIFSIASFLIHEIYSLDVWWQVAIGKDIIEKMSIPLTDHYSAAAQGNPYHDSHWLFQVLLAISYFTGGMTGVQLLMILVWSLTLYGCYSSARRSVTPELSVLLIFIVAMASVERFLPRPEIITFLMISLFYSRLLEHKYRRLSDLAVFAILQAIWTNCHGLFVIGPFMAGCYWLASALKHMRGRESALKEVSILIAVLLAATLITPFGTGGWEYAFLLFSEVGGSAPHLMKAVKELSPTFGASEFSEPSTWFFILLVAAAFTSSFTLMVQRRLSPERALIVAAMFAAALTGRRNMVLFSIVSAPLIAENTALLFPGKRFFRSYVAAAISLIILIWSLYPLSGIYYINNKIPARFGLGATPSYFPHRLPEFLEKIEFKGQVYNSNILGGFYLLHSYPDRVPLTDGRWEIYDEDVLKMILISQFSPQAMRSVVSRFNIKGLLLQHASEEAVSLLPTLRDSNEWKLVYFDYAASFWLKKNGANIKTIDLDSSAMEIAPPARFEDCYMLDNFLRLMNANRLRLINLENSLSFRFKSVDEELLKGEIKRLRSKGAS